MNGFRISLWIVLWATGALAVAAAFDATAKTSVDSASAAVWAGSCTYCHDQGVAPPVFGLGLPAAAIAAVVRGGLSGMPAFNPSELTDAQLHSLADWVARQPAPAKKH